MDRLKDKRVLITGSTRGIGFEIARQACLEGAKVVITGRDQAASDIAANKISDVGGAIAYGIGAPLTDDHAVDNLIADAASKLGGLDVLICPPSAPMAQI